MIQKFSALFVSFAALVSLIFDVRPPGEPITWWQGLLAGLAISFTGIFVYLEYRASHKERTRTFKKKHKFIRFMSGWIKGGGEVTIFDRALSWVDEDLKELLFAKARNGQLNLCLPRSIALAEELRKAGAIVCVYPELDYIPQSRFTVVNTGKADAQVAVGTHTPGEGENYEAAHVVKQFKHGEHDAFFLAEDLMNIVLKYGTCRISAPHDER